MNIWASVFTSARFSLLLRVLQFDLSHLFESFRHGTGIEMRAKTSSLTK